MGLSSPMRFARKRLQEGSEKLSDGEGETKSGEDEALAGNWEFVKSQMSAIAMLALFPFGGHFVRNGLSAVNLYLQGSDDIDFSNEKYGLILSALSCASFIVPLISAHFMTNQWPGLRNLLVIFPCLLIVGQSINMIGIDSSNIIVAVVGAMLMGAGTGCCVMLQRAMVADIFGDSGCAFALGLCVGTANASKTLAKVSMAAISQWSEGDYLFALSFELIPCLISLAIGARYAATFAEDDPRIAGSSYSAPLSANSMSAVAMGADSESSLDIFSERTDIVMEDSGAGGQKRSRSGSEDRAKVTIKAYLGIDDLTDSRNNRPSRTRPLLLPSFMQPQAGGSHKAGGVNRVARPATGELQPLKSMSTSTSRSPSQPPAQPVQYESISTGGADEYSQEGVIPSRAGAGAGEGQRPSFTASLSSSQHGHVQAVRRTSLGGHRGRSSLFGTVSLIMVIVIHSCCINSFHLVNQFGPPILLAKQEQMTPYTAALLASLTTVAPTVGAPLTGWYLDRYLGSAILPMVTIASIFTSLFMYCLLYLDDLPMGPILLAISISEAIMPTAIMVLIPEYVFGEGGALEAEGTARAATATDTAAATPMATDTEASAAAAGAEEVGETSLIYFQKVFAFVSVGDAGVAMVGSSVLGFTLDHAEKAGSGASLIFFLSITTTVVGLLLLAMEWWISK